MPYLRETGGRDGTAVLVWAQALLVPLQTTVINQFSAHLSRPVNKVLIIQFQHGYFDDVPPMMHDTLVYSIVAAQ